MSLIGPYLVSGLCLVLIGTNGAIIYRFWPELWLTCKLIAVSGLLLLILILTRYGDLSVLFLWFGLVVTLADLVAILMLAKAISGARRGDGVLIAYRRR